MMRQIKFRAWDKVKAKMQYNFPIRAEGEYGIDDAFRLMAANENLGVIMQFTGLKDKNGKEIYEGDVVINEYGTHSSIGFEKGHFTMTDLKSGYNRVGIWNVHERCEIIGNIYENPELLK